MPEHAKQVGREEEVTQQDCIMCWEEPRQATLAPCGHRALCASSSVTPPNLFIASSGLKACNFCACR